jgi:predicted dehydrogenase
MCSHWTRRSFIEKMAIGAAAATIVSPRAAAAASFPPTGRSQPAGQPVAPRKSAGQRLNIACIGVRGPGYGAVRKCLETENIVALCDVDDSMMAHTLVAVADAGHPELLKVRRFSDYREMFAQMADKIDAVTVCTPDHHHFPAAMLAIKHTKQVFVQKPLTRTVGEARALKEAARAHGVITQMGNQYHASDGIRLVREWFELGLLGEVREVVAWQPGTASHFLYRPAIIPPAPGFQNQIDWDLWLGPAAERDFAPGCYHPQRWRGWWDFGTGILGDWACHTLDAPFWALDLGAPTSVEADVSEMNPWFVPRSSVVRYRFPARGNLPPVKLTWYEGPGAKPDKPASWDDQTPLPDRGMLMIGSRNTLFHASSPESPRLVSSTAWDELRRSPPKQWIPRVPSGRSPEFSARAVEIAEWLRAIKGEGPLPGSNFDYAADLTQMALLGTAAMRAGKKIEWDNRAGRIVNEPELNRYIEIQARDGWKVS